MHRGAEGADAMESAHAGTGRRHAAIECGKPAMECARSAVECAYATMGCARSTAECAYATMEYACSTAECAYATMECACSPSESAHASGECSSPSMDAAHSACVERRAATVKGTPGSAVKGAAAMESLGALSLRGCKGECGKRKRQSACRHQFLEHVTNSPGCRSAFCRCNVTGKFEFLSAYLLR
jgi:hypothetical protein